MLICSMCGKAITYNTNKTSSCSGYCPPVPEREPVIGLSLSLALSPFLITAVQTYTQKPQRAQEHTSPWKKRLNPLAGTRMLGNAHQSKKSWCFTWVTNEFNANMKSGDAVEVKVYSLDLVFCLRIWQTFDPNQYTHLIYIHTVEPEVLASPSWAACHTAKKQGGSLCKTFNIVHSELTRRVEVVIIYGSMSQD